MRVDRAVAASLAAAAVAVAAVSAHAAATTRPCRGPDLRGTFSVVPGSPGAGQITYRLRVVNRSSTACFVTGIPRLRLLGKRGRALPTNAVAERPGELTAVMVQLAPGKAAALTARFSPDVPGPTEQHPGRCELPAYRLRVSPSGGGSVLVPVRPPTPVCEAGRMGLRAFGPSR